LQTYTTTQMTILYSRGEVEECRYLQSAGLRILLGVFAAFSVLLLVIFALPLDSWLHLTISRFDAQMTLYLLGLQIAAAMLSGFLVGKYMVVRAAHRGTNWQNATQLIVVVLMAGLAMRRVAFYWIAGAQVSLTFCQIFLMIADLHFVAADIRPTLRYWKPGSLIAILKPSGHYALLYSSNILAYQIPVLVMQTLLGPATVVIYSVTRTIYSTGRQLTAMVTNSIGPEVTVLYGERNWNLLYRLYDLSERVVLVVTVSITFASMLATPLLLHFWLHRDELYRPEICLLLGVTMALLSIKEHKYRFQFSSNQVREISYLTIAAYAVMTLVSIPVIKFLRLPGFIALWGATEMVLLYLLLRLNARLFAGQKTLDRRPVYRLFSALAIGSMAIAWPLFHIKMFSYTEQASFSIVCALVAFAISYWLFRVQSVRQILWRKLARRIPLMAGPKVS
jgi:O-antigen/teichoic acid export membrane protein